MRIHLTCVRCLQVLAQVPFPALFSFSQRQYLIESCTVTEAPSLRIFMHQLAIQTQAEKQWLIVGDPRNADERTPRGLESLEALSKTTEQVSKRLLNCKDIWTACACT